MQRIKVEFETEVPDGIDKEAVEAWVSFCLHENGELSLKNPLVDSEIEAENVWVRYV